MTIESEIFKRSVIDEAKLKAYGFKKSAQGFVYTTLFMDDAFKAVVRVDCHGQVSGEVYEVDSDELYLPLRVESMAVGYAGQVRAAYKKVLEDIKARCGCETYFMCPQSNRLAQQILARYGDKPVFPWEKYAGYGVFKNPDNDKWYALLMPHDKNKLDKKQNGETEIINIKLDEAKIQTLLKQKGFYPAYHMNKKTWITVVLDDTLDDDVILSLIDESHAFTLGKSARRKGQVSEWLVPANPKYFDIVGAFKRHKEIIWKQSSDIKKGDIAYMYVGAPYSAVLYKCEVTEADVPYDYEDSNIKINKVMKIKCLKQYDKDFMTFAKLNDYGIRAVRGPRFCPEELSKVL